MHPIGFSERKSLHPDDLKTYSFPMSKAYDSPKISTIQQRKKPQKVTSSAEKIAMQLHATEVWNCVTLTTGDQL